MILKYSKRYLVLSIFQIVIKMIQPFIMIFFPAYLIDAIMNDASFHDSVRLCMIFLSANLIVTILCAKVEEKINVIGNNLNLYFESTLNQHIMNIDYEYLKDPQILDKRDKAVEGIRENGGSNIKSVNENIVTILSSLMIVGGSAYIILRLNIFIVLILLIIITLNLFSEKSIADYEMNSWKRWVPLNRRFRMVYQLMYQFENAKDIRLYDASDFFLSKVKDHNSEMISVINDEARVTAKYTLLTNILNAVQLFTVNATVVYYALNKIISIGEFSMYVTSVNQFVRSATNMVQCFVNIKQNFLYLNEYFSFLELPGKKVKNSDKIKKQNHVFEFQNVSFQYSRDSDFVLKNVSIQLHTGEKLGIVGENGAGKTTFVKLLLRLYDPTEGRILLDGKDIKEYDYEEYKKLFGIVFQDFNLYPVTLQENISCQFGECDKEKFQDVISTLKLDEKISTLDKGVNTILTKVLDEEGVEFSGGEKQKVAIARAIYKEPTVLVMDEPTASLDAQAETEIYQQFHNLAKGRLSLFVSHRLASCVFCDRIMVLEKGEICQLGSHKELILEQDGKYARMFELQAGNYRMV